MSEKAHDFGVDLTDAIELLERPRLTVASASTVDPDTIAAEVFRRRIDPGAGPATVKALLHELLQVKADGSIALAPASLAVRSVAGGAMPLERRYVPAAASVEALSRLAADSLDRVRPLSGLAGAKQCDHAPALDLVRTTIAGLEQQFASGEPIDPAVDDGLSDLEAVLAALETDLGIADAKNMCGREDEQAVAEFTALQTSVATVRKQWEGRAAITKTFDGAKFDRILRQLKIVVLTLYRLQREVSPIAWTSTTVGTITAAQLWKWMRTDAGMTAPALLQARARGAVPRIHKTYDTFKCLLTELVDPAKAPGCRGAFDEKDAKRILNELICHVDHLVQETKP